MTIPTRTLIAIFPIERLQDLAAEGVIGGLTTNFFSFIGYNMDPEHFEATVAEGIARAVDEEERAGVASMTRSRWLRKRRTSAPNQSKSTLNMGQTYNRLRSILESYVADSSTRKRSGEGQPTIPPILWIELWIGNGNIIFT